MALFGDDLARFLVPDARAVDGQSFLGGDASRVHDATLNLSLGFAYCTEDTLAESTAYVVKSLRGLGLSPPENFAAPSSAVKTVNCLYALLQLQQDNTTHKDAIAHDAHKLRLEIDRVDNALRREKERSESLEREIAACLSRETQLIERAKKAAAQAAADRDEFAKAKAAFQSRATQYQHELKRREKEYAKLQEHLSSAVRSRGAGAGAGAAGPKVMTIDITAPLTRAGAVGGRPAQRQTWKPANSHDEQMFAAVVGSYESRQSVLLSENAQLRQCLASLDSELSAVVALVTSGEYAAEGSANVSGDSGHVAGPEDVPQDGEPTMAEMIAAASAPAPTARFEMPIDAVRECIEADVRARLGVLRAHHEAMAARLKGKDASSTAGGQGEQEGEPLCGWETMGAPTGVSEERVRELEEELEACRRVMEEQERLLRDNLDAFHASETPRRNRHAPDRPYLDDSRLYVEAEKLERERAVFEKSRATFEKQRKEVTDAAIQLGRERLLLQRQKDALDEERGVFLRMQQRFLSIQTKSPARPSPTRAASLPGLDGSPRPRAVSVSSPSSPSHRAPVTHSSDADGSSDLSFSEEPVASPAFRSSTPAFSPAPHRVARPLAYANSISAASFSEHVGTASKSRTGGRLVKFDLGGAATVRPGDESLPSPIGRAEGGDGHGGARRLSFG